MSKLPFELLMALRYLRPKRTFVSIITVISIIGVALGVAVLIIVISVMNGYDHDLRQRILGFAAPLTVTQRGSTLSDYEAVSGTIAQNSHVRGVAPFVMGPVLVETQGDTNRPALQDAPIVRGVDPKLEPKVSELPSKVIFGDFDLSGHGVVVGADFASHMNLSIGDHISIYSAREFQKMKAAYDSKKYVTILPGDYEVRGIFSVGYYDYDSKIIITSLENAQDMYDLEDSVHGLFVTLDDPYKAPLVQAQLTNTLGSNYVVNTWLDQNQAILGALVVEKSMMYYITFFIVIVASFGITCTLITFVILKTREIGIMKAVGASDFQVMLIFVSQSVVVSIVGVASGLGLGLFALHVRNDFLHLMNRLMGLDLFNAQVYGFGELPALINPWDITIICGGALVICLMAAILPARYASKLEPVEALRYE